VRLRGVSSFLNAGELLIAYGYSIPVIGSVLVSILPLWLGIVNSSSVALLFSGKPELVFAVLGVFGLVTVPFQAQILSESNEHVLLVLARSRMRKVFLAASAFQAITILLMALLLLWLPSVKSNLGIIGALELFAVSLIAFEFVAMVSNGRAYAEIRENIIAEVKRASLSAQQLNETTG
jgi:hypothetical protein